MVPAVDPLVRAVGVEGGAVAVAELERCGLLPFVGEPVHIGELRGVGAVGGEEREGATGVDGLQLGVVADQQQLPASLRHETGDLVERAGARQRRLVEDHQLPGAQRQDGASSVIVEPLRRVLGGDTEVAGEDLRSRG